LIVAALPPLIYDFPAQRLPTTAAILVISLFGAASAGPLVGGSVAQADAWRAFFLASAGMTVASPAVGVLAIAAQPPFGPAKRFDPGAFVFAFGAAGVFFGVVRSKRAQPTARRSHPSRSVPDCCSFSR